MKRVLLLTVVSLSQAVLAQTFLTVEPLGLDLQGRHEVPLAGADVIVGPKTIDAPHGVRCGGERFEPRVVTVLDRDCEVRLRSGETRSIHVAFEGYTLAVSVQPTAEERARMLGSFEQRSARINGIKTEANFGALKLMDDGRYFIGKANGHWKKHGPGLAFDGPIAHWSMVHLPGGELQFTFLRGPLEYSIVYARTSDEQRAER